MDKNLLKKIPSVSDILGSREAAGLVERFGYGTVKYHLHSVLDGIRAAIVSDARTELGGMEEIASLLEAELTRKVTPEGRRAINATGIILHTGLGRAPLCAEALEALSHFGDYSLVQIDIDDGKRALREKKIEKLLCELTGAEAATVVNNNAAATMLILNTVAAGKEVIVSRGQLVEIGGSFRMPDVMSASGATLREVGTTNRTHTRNYEAAIGEDTGAILHAHTSNYRIRGFTGTPSIDELCSLAAQYDLPVIDDLGSGALVRLSEYGLPDEPLVADSISAGADVVCFSGDKLICGPQSGLICGRREYIERIRKNPFARMFRVCKMTLAVLEATLPHFLEGAEGLRKLPLYRMLARDADELKQQAGELAGELEKISGLEVSVTEDCAYIGSGSIPDEGIPDFAVRLGGLKPNARAIARRLRMGLPSIFGRVNSDEIVFGMRTVTPEECQILTQAVKRALRG